MSIWSLSDNCTFNSVSHYLVKDNEQIKISPKPAKFLELLINAKKNGGDGLLTYDTIANNLYNGRNNSGWDESYQDRLDKMLWRFRKILPESVIIDNPYGEQYVKLSSGLQECRDDWSVIQSNVTAEFPTDDPLCFLMVSCNDSLTHIVYKNISGDELIIDADKYIGMFHELPLGSLAGNIRLNHINTINNLVYGFINDLISTITINKDNIGPYDLIKYGVDENDLLSIINFALLEMKTHNNSYSSGYLAFTIQNHKLNERLNKTDNTYFAKYDLDTSLREISTWAEDRLINRHDKTALIILSWLSSHYKIAFEYPELVYAYLIALRSSIEDKKKIDQFDSMAQALYKNFENKFGKEVAYKLNHSLEANIDFADELRRYTASNFDLPFNKHFPPKYNFYAYKYANITFVDDPYYNYNEEGITAMDILNKLL